MTSLREFLKLESASGIILVIAAVIAMIMANSPLSVYYDMLIDMPVEVRVGPLELAKPLLLWINDGLMAVFFFLVGLELKRELMEGELKQVGNVVLPGLAAVGGMLVPAMIYIFFNHGNVDAMQGWAIPTATDIAFALGVLSLFGNRVPTSLKIFLVSLAIFDDMGAIIIIALFYTAEISTLSLIIASACLAVLFVLNR
ncbi:MAG: Na+/H+ antiporter NhaA, partial [Sedimenticola sp.]